MEFREITERYDLAKILRSGRSGTVLRAVDRSTGQPVAVKMIQAGAVPLEEAAARFEAFAAALAVLRHPALPAVLDSGLTADGSAFLVLELLEGRGLDTLAGKLAPDVALALLGQTLDGLEAMAARGLAHGNLSSENLFLVGDAQVKLLGLGSAVFRGVAAAAPELAQGGVATARSDLFSFAQAACQVLGAAVTPGDSRSVQLPFSVTLELADDGALRTILERLLQLEPAERPSFREVRAAFRQALGQPAGQPAPAPVAATPPPTPAPPPSAIPVPAPPPEPEAAMPVIPAMPAIPEGDVLPEITDEVLDALAAPPPLPEPGEAVAAAAPAPSRPRRGVLLGALAAALLVVVLAGVWLLRRPVEETAAPAVPAGPVVPPPPSPQALMARLDEARLLLDQGEEDKAREALREISFAGQSALPPAACARLAEMEELLGMMAVEHLPADLERGLETGDLGLLRSVVATGSGLGPSLPAELKEGFETARRLVELHRLAEADAGEGKHAAVLERMAELSSLAPKLGDPLDLREKSAAALETEAEGLARAARYDEAVAKLEPLQRTWAGREGLAARLAGYRVAKDDEAKQQALLASIPAWERRKKPHEALDLLRGVKPTPHLQAQLEKARQRLEAQLAQLDQAPPVVELRPGVALEYSRGNPVQLELRVRDDYLVHSVKMMARPPGGKMREMPLEEHRGGGYWSIELPVSFHQNGTVEFYVVATDLSGHEGSLGTREKPEKVTRIGSNRV
jgi:hypothetical protein